MPHIQKVTQMHIIGIHRPVQTITVNGLVVTLQFSLPTSTDDQFHTVAAMTATEESSYINTTQGSHGTSRYPNVTEKTPSRHKCYVSVQDIP